MSIIYRKDKDSKGKCSICGKDGDVIGEGICRHCSAKRCSSKVGSFKNCSCDLSIPFKKKGESYLPCLNFPICRAIFANVKEWRDISPRDEVEYNGRVGY